MFWRKRKFNDPDLGELTFEAGCWGSSIIDNTNQQLVIDIDGSKYEPDLSALQQTKSVLSNVWAIKNRAVAYIESEDISHFIKNMGTK